MTWVNIRKLNPCILNGGLVPFVHFNGAFFYIFFVLILDMTIYVFIFNELDMFLFFISFHCLQRFKITLTKSLDGNP